MFSNNKVITTLVSGFTKGVHRVSAFISDNRRTMVMALCMLFVVAANAQGVSTDTGVTAINSVADSLKHYIEPVRVLCYALAGIIAIGGGISVYIKMNNEEQDVKKSIMMIVGACIFLIAAATFLPKFFGL
jgi:hypothetical protein